MKTVIDLTSLADNFSGFERFALNIALELLRQNPNQTFVLVFKGEVYPSFEMYRGKPEVSLVVLPRKDKLWSSQVTLLAALKKIQADCYFFPAFPAPLFFRARGIVNTIHDMGCWDCAKTMPLKMVVYFRMLYRNAARRSAYIVTVSKFSRTRIQKILKVDKKRIKVVYNGVSDDLYQQDEEKWNGIKKKYHMPDRYIMCLSTLEPRKNLKLLLQAYKELLESGEAMPPLVLAGRKGWKLDQVLGKLSCIEKGMVRLTGYVEEADLSLLYKHAEWFVFPSLYEGFGIPPLEAMAAGCKVISSDAEAMKEVLGSHAVYFKNNNKEDLKKVLSECVQGIVQVKSPDELKMYSRRFSYAEEVRHLCLEVKNEWRNS